MPVREMTDQEAEMIFGGGQIIFGMKRPTSSGQNSDSGTPPTSANPAQGSRLQDLQNLPVDPAAWAMKESASKGPSTTGNKQG